MKKTKMLEMLNELHEIDQENSKIIDEFYALGIDCECAMFKRLFKTFQFALDQTALILHDNYQWLEWFIYENDWGKNKHVVEIDNQKFVISTFEDLINILINEELQNQWSVNFTL